MNQVGKAKLVEIFEADFEAAAEIADDAGTRKSIFPNLKKTESWTAFCGIWDQIQMNSFTNLDLFLQILWLKSKKNKNWQSVQTSRSRHAFVSSRIIYFQVPI
jgi:hypothetical protein